MDQQEAKTSLLHYLSNKTAYPVIALKGQWGSGKTYVWREVEKTIQKDARRRPLYASLFGVASISELKERLHSAHLDQRIPRLSRPVNLIRNFWKKVPTAVSDASKSVGAALGAANVVSDEVNSAIIGRLLRNRLVVLDDLERCDTSLSITSVLGFIEYLRGNGCQVLVIFNEQKFTAKGADEAILTFREKVFDLEMQLVTTPSEAFLIALKKDHRPPHFEKLGQCCIDLGVSNIRVAKRIINVAKQVFGRHADLDEKLVIDSLPAVAVTTAMFYTSIEAAPTLKDLKDFVNRKGPKKENSDLLDSRSPEELKKLVEFKARYIPAVDLRFFNLLTEHIETGNILDKEFAKYWFAVSEQLKRRRLEEAVYQWAEDIEWHPTITQDQVLVRAKQFESEMGHLTDTSRRVLSQELKKLDENELAEAFERHSESVESIPYALGSSDSVRVNSDDSLQEKSRSELEAVRKLVIEIAGRDSGYSGWVEQLERVTVEQFVELLSADTAKEFKAIIIFIHRLHKNGFSFDASRLAIAVEQVMLGDGGKRRLHIVNNTGFAAGAVDQLLLLAKGETVSDWPRRPELP